MAIESIVGKPRTVLDVTRDSENSSVLIVTIANPNGDLNLWDFATMEEFASLWGDLRVDTEVRAVVVTAKGRYFCAGGHFEVMASQHDPAKVEYLARLTRRLYFDMLDTPAPIVCAMNGPGVGAGCSVALLSDIRFASSTVTISDPHVSRGLTAGLGVSIWSLYLGPSRLKRFLLTGELIGAQQALQDGLMDYVCEPDELLPKALAMARRLASQPPLAVAHTKLLANKHIRESLDTSFITGAALQAQDFHSNDHAEAINAFQEHRAATYVNS